MAKFNVVQKKRRAAIADRKRVIHGDPTTRKLHQKIQPQSISRKRLRKLEKKLLREQKDAVEKGLITMEDVEMAVADEPDENANKPSVKLSVKKSSRLRVKQLKKKGKSKKKSKKPRVEEASNSAMVE